jgi:DNA-binding response OmpR family regulator
MPAQHYVLMIEDDQRLGGMVASYLGQNGFTVTQAENAKDGLAMLAGRDVDLILLDLMLPDMDGLEVCRRIRAMGAGKAGTPVLMLTAKGDPLDRVIGLELGADDYLAKPFEPRELLARMRAILRRPQMASPAPQVMQFGRLSIDPDARTVSVDGVERPITSYQFDLLKAMADRAGRVLSREQLLDAVKGEQFDPFDRSIDVHIGRLRAAIEDDPRHPRRIVTVRGAGYVFAKVQDA